MKGILIGVIFGSIIWYVLIEIAIHSGALG